MNTPSHSYRPIAPSIAPPAILPHPNTLDGKRKWSSILQDSTLDYTHGKFN